MMHIRDMEDATARYSMCGAKVAYLGDFYSEPPPTGYRVCKRCQVKRDRVLQRTPSGVQSS